MANSSQTARRKPRADAQRNRERLIELAREAFARSGPSFSLDELARRAGVGPGTLYRHFPTRNALLEAVYSAEADKLAAAERSLAKSHLPGDALRAWLLLFVDYLATKLLIAEALNVLLHSPSPVFACSGEKIRTAINSLARRAIQSGDLRPDVDPLDLLRAITGVANIATDPDWPAHARQFVDILLSGARPAL